MNELHCSAKKKKVRNLSEISVMVGCEKREIPFLCRLQVNKLIS
jgi:hypothetical protein